MIAFWNRLSDREKLFVAIGAVIAAIVIILQLIVAPALGWRESASERRDRAEDLYRLVSEASASAGIVAQATGVDLDTPIINALTQTTAEFAVTVNFRNARDDGGVEANVTAGGERLFDWLRALEARYGVSVAAADIARSADGESVQAQLTLVRRTVR
ncbi:MAG: type II secretion system protein M [Parvularculaceae bacterium]|nr:type II secretion system protein M [Parvularculaceae bacterium]